MPYLLRPLAGTVELGVLLPEEEAYPWLADRLAPRLGERLSPRERRACAFTLSPSADGCLARVRLPERLAPELAALKRGLAPERAAWEDPAPPATLEQRRAFDEAIAQKFGGERGRRLGQLFNALDCGMLLDLFGRRRQDWAERRDERLLTTYPFYLSLLLPDARDRAAGLARWVGGTLERKAGARWPLLLERARRELAESPDLAAHLRGLLDGGPVRDAELAPLLEARRADVARLGRLLARGRRRGGGLGEPETVFAGFLHYHFLRWQAAPLKEAFVAALLAALGEGAAKEQL